MRLKNYILREARVRKTNADIFLTDYASIFMWKPKEGLLWSVYDKKDEIWRFFWNKDEAKTDIPYRYNINCMTHPTLLKIVMKRVLVEDWIKGRIKPDGSEIFIHDSEYRNSPMMMKRFDYFVDKAVDAVYKYMRDYIK